jgi:hypothetical protein
MSSTHFDAVVVGSGLRGTIVAEVLVGLVRRSENSILPGDGWEPTLPSAQQGTFDLPDLLRFAGVSSNEERRRCDENAIQEALKDLETRLEAYLVEWRRHVGIEKGSEASIDRKVPRLVAAEWEEQR